MHQLVIKRKWIKRKKVYNVGEALVLFQDLSKRESDGSEVSDLSDEDWVEKESSHSEPEPPLLKKTKKSPSADISMSTLGRRGLCKMHRHYFVNTKQLGMLRSVFLWPITDHRNHNLPNPITDYRMDGRIIILHFL